MSIKAKDLYGVAKTVITSKNYELKDMLNKLETLWFEGNITEEQKLELMDIARNNAMSDNSLDILKKLAELDARIKALEDEKANSDSEEVVVYPPYEAGVWYYNGDIVDFEGKNHRCTAPVGTVCVWSPAEYPAYWEVYTNDAPLTE